MARPKKKGMLNDRILQFRGTEEHEALFEKIGEILHEQNPLDREPNQSDVIRTLLKLGVMAFESKFGKVKIPKREKKEKI